MDHGWLCGTAFPFTGLHMSITAQLGPRSADGKPFGMPSPPPPPPPPPRRPPHGLQDIITNRVRHGTVRHGFALSLTNSRVRNPHVSFCTPYVQIRINGKQYRGSLQQYPVLRALCAGFPAGQEPPECNSAAVSEDECAPGGVGERACMSRWGHA